MVNRLSRSGTALAESMLYNREIFDLQTSALACGFCSTPFQSGVLPIPCTSSSTNVATRCTFYFCNRLCLSRSARTHPLLCPAKNPASAPFMAYAVKYRWMALHALAQCTARVLLSQDETENWDILRGFAQLGMEERSKDVILCVYHFVRFCCCMIRWPCALDSAMQIQIGWCGRKLISCMWKHSMNPKDRWRRRNLDG
jgi:hypothetical protein